METSDINIIAITCIIVWIAFVIITSIIVWIDAGKIPREYIQKKDTPDNDAGKIPASTLPVMAQFDYGQMQLDYIDQVVSALIEIKIANNVILGQSYSTLHIDSDIEELVTEVKNALQPKFFDENNSMYSNTFLIKYIVEKCKIGLIAASKKQN